MGENSAISWTDHTQNFWIGCEEVSAACDFCYARDLAERYGWAKWGPKEPRHRTSYANWRKPYAWERAAAKAGTNPKVFTNSLADFFDNKVDPSWRTEAWRVIKDTQHLTWLILTKRPQNIAKMVPGDWWPLPNVWLGTTAENQDEYLRRRRHLFAVPAARHFISYEPALGPLDIQGPTIPDWIICGGESGDKRRSFDLQWAERLREQCDALGVAFFFKQDSAFKPGQRGRASDALWACKQFPGKARVAHGVDEPG